VDGLKGFPDATPTAFPEAQIQLFIMYMICNSISSANAGIKSIQKSVNVGAQIRRA
jgi:transposase-like protein